MKQEINRKCISLCKFYITEKGYILRGAYYTCTKEKDLYTISYQGYIVGKASFSLDAYTIIANHYTYSIFGK